jgi:U4/U6.U5 tri-snRNP-associated protein 3
MASATADRHTSGPRGRGQRPSSTQMWEENETPKAGDRRVDPPRDKREHLTPPSDTRPKDNARSSGHKRSRSPRDEGRRDDHKRHRSRSPYRDSRGRGRDRDSRDTRDSRNGRYHDDYKKDRGGNARDRPPPSGPRADRGPRRPDVRAGGPVKAHVEPEQQHEPEQEKDVRMGGTDGKPEDMDDDTWTLMKTMGFGGFKSTKDTKVPGNDKNFAVRRDKKVKARQYMNRKGGFNRPLSPSRT